LCACLILLNDKHKANRHFKLFPDCKKAVEYKCVEFLLHETAVINELRLDKVINNDNSLNSSRLTKQLRKCGYF
jgi:hypothetical protein